MIDVNMTIDNWILLSVCISQGKGAASFSVYL